MGRRGAFKLIDTDSFFVSPVFRFVSTTGTGVVVVSFE
jgi:hypothetical protein